MTTDFAATKALFHIPDGMIYLDGNSLGPLPKSVPAEMGRVLREEWGEMLITGWNKARWMEQSLVLGDRIARLIGAETGSVIVGDTLSIKVYQALASALEMTDRKVVLSDNGNFPSDLYMAEGLLGSLRQGHELRVVDPEAIENNLTKDIGVLMITEVDYRTGRLHDMKRLTEKAHGLGILTVWDLAHTAGATEVKLAECGADFAVGCTYKYLNGGPGAPAFIYVAPRHHDATRPALSGWLGHEAPFAFDLNYRPHEGITRMRVGTPPVLGMASLNKALDAWDGVEMAEVRARSMELTDLFVTQVEARCPELELGSPRDASARGSQVSFKFAEGYAAMQALIARGVVGDFRAPDVMRFGFTPLYIDRDDVLRAAEILEEIIRNRLWDRSEYKIKSAVT